MRKYIYTIAWLLFFGTAATAQFAEIASLNGVEFCNGYGEDNYAYLSVVSGAPMGVSPSFRLEFKWMVKHDKGSWTWLTQSHSRPVPLPWEGEYKIQLYIYYFYGLSTSPFAFFMSNVTTVTAYSCGSE